MYAKEQSGSEDTRGAHDGVCRANELPKHEITLASIPRTLRDLPKAPHKKLLAHKP